MIYRNDRDALAYRDRELMRGDDYDDYDTEECRLCGDTIYSGEVYYKNKAGNHCICEHCYEELEDERL